MVIDKILIANRGEIAVRVIRTAKRLGITTVAVYSEADRDTPHVMLADEAVLIGPPPPSESYLRIDKIIAAALEKGAQAIHPGYGFLSENKEFPIRCQEAGLTFIGPASKTIEVMGSKSAAKALMKKAGVPVLPGYEGPDQTVDSLMQAAEKIGYPVLLKAAAGGGGKGMRLVTDSDEFSDQLRSAKREAQAAFGDDEFLVEKYLENPRHIEVQVFGDNHGNVVHLFERDCSIQRRHQKIIEEAPAPNLPNTVREQLLEAGVNAAKAINYSGAGTVEFLYDGSSKVYFMEMNTRLQVEHPVTEAITGLDLVEWQIRVAEGEEIPLQQHEIHEKGHSFEARLYAEDPENEFLPSTGTLTTLSFPDNCRIDTGVEAGSVISPTYDPMIAKIITHNSTREKALSKLRQALSATYTQGLNTNTTFLHSVAEHPDFIAGNVSTGFIEKNAESLFGKSVDTRFLLSAGILFLQATHDSHTTSCWKEIPGFRLNGPSTQIYWFNVHKQLLLLRSQQLGNGYRVTVEVGASAAERKIETQNVQLDDFQFSGKMHENRAYVEIEQDRHQAYVAQTGTQLRVWVDGISTDLDIADPLSQRVQHEHGAGNLLAPMPGTIIELSLAPNTVVKKGETLLVMEAMKMEHAIKAPSDGTLLGYRFEPGSLVDQGAVLVDFEE